MDHSQTQKLMRRLQDSESVSTVLSNCSDDFVACPLCDALKELLEKKNMTRAQVIRNAMLNAIYGQQIFAGKKTPSRDKLLMIAFGMQLSFEEVDTLLRRQGYPRLYPRNERDAVILYGFLHRMSLMDINTVLYDNDMETLM